MKCTTEGRYCAICRSAESKQSQSGAGMIYLDADVYARHDANTGGWEPLSPLQSVKGALCVQRKPVDGQPGELMSETVESLAQAFDWDGAPELSSWIGQTFQCTVKRDTYKDKTRYVIGRVYEIGAKPSQEWKVSDEAAAELMAITRRAREDKQADDGSTPRPPEAPPATDDIPF